MSDRLNFRYAKPEACRDVIFERLGFTKAHAEAGMIYAEILDDEGLARAVRLAVSHLAVALDVLLNLEEAKKHQRDRDNA